MSDGGKGGNLVWGWRFKVPPPLCVHGASMSLPCLFFFFWSGCTPIFSPSKKGVSPALCPKNPGIGSRLPHHPV